MTPWQRFARRRLAVTRWQCEPEHIPADQQTAFDDAFARQCQLEEAVVEVAASAPCRIACCRVSQPRWQAGWMAGIFLLTNGRR